MTAEQHAVVWNNVADRMKRFAEAAKVEGAPGVETALLQLAVFAGTIAAAYNDTATAFKADR